jgi:hypothetical protein
MKIQNYEIHNTVAVRITTNHNQYAVEWADEDGNNKAHICYVFGFDNAIRVANGIAHHQCEYVTHPAFNPEEVQNESN